MELSHWGIFIFLILPPSKSCTRSFKINVLKQKGRVINPPKLNSNLLRNFAGNFLVDQLLEAGERLGADNRQSIDEKGWGGLNPEVR